MARPQPSLPVDNTWSIHVTIFWPRQGKLMIFAGGLPIRLTCQLFNFFFLFWGCNKISKDSREFMGQQRQQGHDAKHELNCHTVKFWMQNLLQLLYFAITGQKLHYTDETIYSL